MATESLEQAASDQPQNTEVLPITCLYQATKKPWVTWLIIAACVIVHIGLIAEHNNTSWETLKKWGCLPAYSIWDGAYWGLFTSVFVHFEHWHLFFNMFWLWVLGRAMERTIGSFRFLAFFVFSAFISSAFQLLASDDCGIGASGVVYSIFGFMLFSRNLVPQFRKIITPQIVNLFLIWLAGCYFATHFKILNVGNAAHASGLVFGSFVACYFMVCYKPFLTLPGLTFVIVFPIVTLFWCPWSVNWLSIKARDAQIKEQYTEAIQRYTQVLQLDQENAWAYYNRGRIYEYLERAEEAKADLAKAKELGFLVDEND